MKVSETPLIVDLGKLRPKKVKQLKKGSGPYLDGVLPAIAQVRAEAGKRFEGKEIVPVVIIYEKKRKRRTLSSLF
jgi:hypothetical protein